MPNTITPQTPMYLYLNVGRSTITGNRLTDLLPTTTLPITSRSLSGWRVGLSAISLPDPTSQAPPLIKDNDPMFISNWVGENVGSSRGKELYSAFFTPSNLKEDLVILTRLGFMKTMPAFFDKKQVENVMKPGYQFVDDDNEKRTYVKFKWEG